MKHRVTLEVDSNQVFDVLAKDRDLQRNPGDRMVSLMLSPNGVFDAIGLGLYGITVVDDGRAALEQGHHKPRVDPDDLQNESGSAFE